MQFFYQAQHPFIGLQRYISYLHPRPIKDEGTHVFSSSSGWHVLLLGRPAYALYTHHYPSQTSPNLAPCIHTAPISGPTLVLGLLRMTPAQKLLSPLPLGGEITEAFGCLHSWVGDSVVAWAMCQPRVQVLSQVHLRAYLDGTTQPKLQAGLAQTTGAQS